MARRRPITKFRCIFVFQREDDEQKEDATAMAAIKTAEEPDRVHADAPPALKSIDDLVNVSPESKNGGDANSQHTPSRMPHMRNETDLLHRTPSGGRGPRLLWLLCAEFSESS